MNSTNLMTAIDDPNLYGNCLTVPLRLSIQAFRRTFSVWPVDLSSSQKIVEIFKRAAFSTLSLGIIPAFPLALIGVAVKWIDLGIRMNQLVHQGSAMGSHLPWILKQSSRLGDRTVAYLNTKYVAEKYDLPVYFVPFKGCENFRFSQEETFTGPQYFKKVIHLKSAADIEALAHIDKSESTLYLLPFFTHTRNLQEEGPGCSYIKYEIDWPSFRPRVGELLTVVKPHTLMDIPENAYSIALHIRDGGDYDDEKVKTMHPLKLPSMNFYLGELKRVLTSDQIPVGMPVFVHIFTDALHPEKVQRQVAAGLLELAEQGPAQVDGIFSETAQEEVQVNSSEFVIQGRKVKLSYQPNPKLTDDIANMGRFKCMIRADSNLSGPLGEGSGTLEVDIFPTHCKVDPNWKEISISRVRIVTHSNEITNVETDYPKKVETGGLPIWFFRKFHEYYGVLQSK